MSMREAFARGAGAGGRETAVCRAGRRSAGPSGDVEVGDKGGEADVTWLGSEPATSTAGRTPG
jgi:hypothetical protein